MPAPLISNLIGQIGASGRFCGQGDVQVVQGFEIGFGSDQRHMGTDKAGCPHLWVGSVMGLNGVNHMTGHAPIVLFFIPFFRPQPGNGSTRTCSMALPRGRINILPVRM